MSEEQHIVPYLIRIANTISTILLWLIANVFLGIFLNYAFFKGSPNIYNMIYYVFVIVSGFFLVRHIIKKWKPKP
jgi:uncharacterized protein YneF (UPF0154 family)